MSKSGTPAICGRLQICSLPISRFAARSVARCEAFTDYVRSIRSALSEYRCEISECLAEGDRAFAKVVFSVRHVGVFRGYPPTGKRISWVGAALFRFRGELISSLWALGDVAALDATLRENQGGLTDR